MTDATREPRRSPRTRKRSGQEIARLLHAAQLALPPMSANARANLRIFRGRASKYRIIRAGTRSRQQCRSGPQGPQEENATRGNFPRNEASRPLREALGEEGARKGRGRSARAQARSQEVATRGPASDETEAGPGGAEVGRLIRTGSMPVGDIAPHDFSV